MEHKHTPGSPEDPSDLDAWECVSCGGAGRVARYSKVTHLLGSDELPFWEECETCEGSGFNGPDADRAAIAKAAGDKHAH